MAPRSTMVTRRGSLPPAAWAKRGANAQAKSAPPVTSTARREASGVSQQARDPGPDEIMGDMARSWLIDAGIRET